MIGGEAGFTDNSVLGESGEKSTSGSHSLEAVPDQPPKCPECDSQQVWKDGIRQTKYGDVQRYLCRNCGYRFSSSGLSKSLKKRNVLFQGFSELPNAMLDPANIQSINFLARKESHDNFPFVIGENVTTHSSKPQFSTVGKSINTFVPNSGEHRVCAFEKRAKNLENQAQYERPSVGGTEQIKADIKGKLVEYAFYMQKQGYSNETIRCNTTALKVLTVRGAFLLDPESVKEVIAKQKLWSENRKRNVINAYSLFLKINGLTWEKPKCHVTQKFPFIPTEREIDDLIAGCGKKTAAFLQLMKETAMRCGEAKRLEWANVDAEKNIITLNLPEKRSNPRMWKVSQKLVDMLKAMPKDSQKVFW